MIKLSSANFKSLPNTAAIPSQPVSVRKRSSWRYAALASLPLLAGCGSMPTIVMGSPSCAMDSIRSAISDMPHAEIDPRLTSRYDMCMQATGQGPAPSTFTTGVPRLATPAMR